LRVEVLNESGEVLDASAPLNGDQQRGQVKWTDGNSDGDVDLTDYNALASNFQPLGYGAAAVPEPSAALLALLATLLVSTSGRLSNSG